MFCENQVCSRGSWVKIRKIIILRRNLAKYANVIRSYGNCNTFKPFQLKLQGTPSRGLPVSLSRYVNLYEQCAIEIARSKQNPYLSIESLLGSYGWSLEGISRIAGTGAVCWSIVWRIMSAIWKRMQINVSKSRAEFSFATREFSLTFWLMRMMSMSSLRMNFFRQSSSSVRAVSRERIRHCIRTSGRGLCRTTHSCPPPWSSAGGSCSAPRRRPARSQRRCPEIRREYF